MTERETNGIARRAVLRGLGAVGLGLGASGLASAQTNVITINSPSEYRLAYQFSVTGSVSKRTYHAGGPDVSHEYVTDDPEDYVDGNRVHGITQGGYDAYEYTGRISSFDISDQGGGTRGCHHANIWINGQPVDACNIGDGGSPPSTNVITINSPSEYRLAYQFSVSGSVSKRTSHAGGPDVSHEYVTDDPEDYVDGNRVHGITQGGYDAYEYTGDLLRFDISDQGGGTRGCHHANVWINGQPVDACRLPE